MQYPKLRYFCMYQKLSENMNLLYKGYTKVTMRSVMLPGRLDSYIVLIALLCVATVSTTVVDPTSCPCAVCDDLRRTVDCSDAGLTQIPSPLPEWTRILKLNRNRLTRLESSIFYSNRNLEVLELDENQISDIEINAFRNLYKLERLSLKDNHLRQIKSHFFHHLTELRMLDLSFNQIRSVTEDALRLTTYIQQVVMEHNPLHCDCTTVNFYQSLKPNVLVKARCVNLQNQLIENIAYPGICKGTPVPDVVCPMCTAESSITACLKKTTKQYCSRQKNACNVEVISQISGSTLVSSRCESPGRCEVLMRENSASCLRNSPSSMCQFCCTARNCVNEDLLKGFSISQQYQVLLPIFKQWHNDYRFKNSAKYKELKDTVASQFERVMDSGPPGTCLITNDVMTFDKGDQDNEIKVEFELSCTLPPNTPVPPHRDAVYLNIKSATRQEKFTFGIDTQNFNIDAKTFCTTEIPRRVPDKGLIHFTSQLGGQTSYAPCPENTESQASMTCCSADPEFDGSMESGGKYNWNNLKVNNCQNVSERTKELEDLSTRPVTNETANDISGRLANITQDVRNFTHREVSLVADVAQNVLTAPSVPIEKDMAAKLTASMSQMMSVETEALIEAEINSSASTRFVELVEKLGLKMPGSEKGVKVAEQYLGVVAVSGNDSGLQFEVTGNADSKITTDRLLIGWGRVNKRHKTSNTASIHLPASAVKKADNKNIHFAVFNEAKFFLAAEAAKQSVANNTSQNASDKFLLNSRIVSAKVGSQTLANLPEPVTITLQHIVQNSSNHVCVYWNYEVYGWRQDGCEKKSSNDETTTCQCNHLTNFALLLDIYGTASKLPEGHKIALSFISYIGCGVSAAGLIFTLITYFSFRKMLRDNPSKILVNLCIALLGIMVAFIFTTQPFVRNNFVACKFFAALTHYFVLAAMGWMSVEAFYMYIAIVRVFHTYYSKFLLKCSLVGWGLPSLAVIITVAVSRENYGLQGEICWLGRIPFIAAVVAPIAVSLILNCVAFGLVIHQLKQMDSRKLEKSKRSNIISRLRGAISIMVLLGLTWMFAFFAIGSAGIVFHYLFAIFNSLQGLFIFVFYCLLKRDAQIAWLTCCGLEHRRTSSATSSRAADGYDLEGKAKSNSIAPVNEPYNDDEYSPPTKPRRVSCFARRSSNKPTNVRQQSAVTTSTTEDEANLVDSI